MMKVDDELKKIVTEGKGRCGPLPASPAAVDDVVAFVRTLKKEGRQAGFRSSLRSCRCRRGCVSSACSAAHRGRCAESAPPGIDCRPPLPARGGSVAAPALPAHPDSANEARIASAATGDCRYAGRSCTSIVSPIAIMQAWPDDVFQFAHVSRPGVQRQHESARGGSGRESPCRTARRTGR